MGWIGQLIEQRRLRALTAEVEAVKGEALEPDLARAVAETGRVLPRRLLDRRTRPLHASLVLIFARQVADANRRLGSSYWSSGGRNVGKDVLQAEGYARAALLKVLAHRPTAQRPLSETVDVVDRLIVAQREDPLDQDGYGLGTLHEIRRDLAELALRETAPRN